MTKLEAVNQMLALIELAPVDSLETGDPTVDIAVSQLNQTTRFVQAEGWWFNTELNVMLSPNAQQEVQLPANTLKADPQKVLRDYVQRGLKLYDKVGHTFAIGESVGIDLVLGLGFDELPFSAQNYITIKAARVFAKNYRGGETALRWSDQDEGEARLVLVSEHAESSDANFLYTEPMLGEGMPRFDIGQLL